MDHLCYLWLVFVMLLRPFIAALWSLAGKGLAFGSLVCDVFLCYCHFPMWCPGSGVVLDCIDSLFLLSSYLHIS